MIGHFLFNISMKKIMFSSLISCVFLLISCSKNDDNKDSDVDLVFTAPYVPLSNIDEIKSTNTWYYQGAKIGPKKFGQISNSSCLSNNILVFHQTPLAKKDSIVYLSYDVSDLVGKGCKLDFKRTIRRVKFVSEGKIFVDIYDYSLQPVFDNVSQTTRYDTIKNVIYEGNLEVGFQKSMLRVEDKFTHYNGKEKVYLYFKGASK